MIFFLFPKESKSEKKKIFFEGVKVRRGMGSVSEFILQKNPNLKKEKIFFSFLFIFYFFLCVWRRGGGG